MKKKNKTLKKLNKKCKDLISKIKSFTLKVFKNKKVIISLIIILSLIFISLITFAIIKKHNDNKTISYDLETIKENSLSYYSDLDVRIMDFMDLTNIFGISFNETEENALFIGNYNYEKETSTDLFYLVVINNEDYQYYYDIFNSYIDSALNNETDEEILNLYRNAILKKGNNYVYFILNNDATTIEKDINSHILED